jgi:tetratricopeptide (TPR) repeat protein
MGVKFRDAAPMPASLDSFKVELGRQGFDRAAQVYASIQKREPDFKLDTNALISWGYALLVAGHLPESIAIMKLNAQLFPSGDAFVGLGEAYMMSGQMKAAIESYNKALEKTPDNVAFKQRLDVLEASRLLRK